MAKKNNKNEKPTNKKPTNKQQTNFLEILFRHTLIGLTIYDDDGNGILIDDINYDPMIQILYVKSGNESYKMTLTRYYDFVLDGELEKIFPKKEKIKGYRGRRKF